MAARGSEATARASTRAAAAHGREAVQVQKVAQSYDQVDRAAKRAAAGERRAAAARRRATADARTQARGAVSTGMGMAGFAGAFGLAGAVRQTVEFDRGMRNVNSIAQLSETRFERLSKRVRDLGGRVAQAPKTLAEGLYDLVSSGFKANDAMRVLRASSKAATAGLTTTEVSTKAVAAVLNAYELPAKKAKYVSDVLFRTVDRGVVSFEDLAQNIGDVLPWGRQLGVGVDELGAAVATLTKKGESAPEAMTKIKGAMVALLKPSEDMKAAYDELGVASGTELIKKTGSLQGALQALEKTTGGNAEKLQKLFRDIRGAGGAMQLTGKNARAANRDLDSFAKVSGATNKALREQSKSTAYQWERLKATASGIGIALGSEVLPRINDTIEGVLKFGHAHPNILKVAAALIAVGLATKAIKFTSALLGLTDLVRYARRTPNLIRGALGTVRGIVNRIMGRAGAAGGTALAETAASTAASNVNTTFSRRSGKFRTVGRTAGKWVGRGVGVGIVAGLALMVPDIADALAKLLTNSLDKLPGPLRGLAERALGIHGRVAGNYSVIPEDIRNGPAPGAPRNPIGGRRRGGRIRRFMAGGRVPALVSSGELIEEPDGRTWTVPGPRVAADNVFTYLRPESFVYTDHGQQMRSAGASRDEIEANQLPHFRKGGGVARAARSGIKNVGDWSRALLDRLKIRRSATAIYDLRQWAAIEGGHWKNSARYNPLNTTYAMPGAVAMNSHGVKAYKSWAQGLTATASTLRLGSYKAILAALRRGTFDQFRSAVLSSPWGTTTIPGGPGPKPGTGIEPSGTGARRGRVRLGFGSQLPSARGGWASGYQTGAEGGDLWSSDTVRAALASGRAKIQVEGPPGGRGGAASLAGARGKVKAAILEARALDRARYPYRWGGGHTQPARPTEGIPGGPHRGTRAGYDCSGAVARVMQRAGFNFPTGTSGTYMGWGASGPGRAISVYASPKHTFMRLRRSFFGTSSSNPAGGPGWLGKSYSTSGYTVRHPPGYRLGGPVARFRRGGELRDSWKRVRPGGGGVFGDQGLGDLRTLKVKDNRHWRERLRAFSRMIDKLDETGETIVKGRIRDIRREVQRLERGGIKKGERKQVRALRRERRQLRDDLTDVPSYGRLEKIETSLQRQVRRVRRGGVDGRGEQVAIRRLQAAMRVTQTEMGRRTGLLVQTVEKQANALERARTRLSQGLRRRGIDEASSQGVEAARDLAKAQHERLVKMRDQLKKALVRARRRGDRAAVQDIQGRLDGVRDEMSETFTSWVERAREAVRTKAQEGVDVAAHGSSMASIRLQRLELEQRLAGTFEGGGGARADYINNTIVPALQAEIAALNQQYAAAAGDVAAQRAIEEAREQKKLELLEAQVQATEEVKESVDELREHTGSLGFDFASQQHTDLFSSIGGGA